MYHEYTQEQLRAYSRTYIETLEIWARQLIHEKMTEEYGDNYIFLQFSDGNFLVKKEIRDHVSHMLSSEPDRFNRPIDTLFFDHIIYFLSNEQWYKKLFREPLSYTYPQGAKEVRVFLERLTPIRNPLSHSTPITMHDVERAICYSHDFIEGLKKYYVAKGKEKMYNVPRIIKVSDSLGNIFNNIVENSRLGMQIIIPQAFNCGDKYSVEIEIDSSFGADEYTIKWNMARHTAAELGNSQKLTLCFEPQDVSEAAYIYCTIVQNKEWHKYGDHDSKITLCVKILPPIND